MEMDMGMEMAHGRGHGCGHTDKGMGTDTGMDMAQTLGVSSENHELMTRAHSGSVRRVRPRKKPGRPKSLPTGPRHARVADAIVSTRSSTPSAA
jgi:hypothetical protein